MNWELVVCAGMIAAACALAGVFLVLRRTAMLADAVSHAILPGLVGAYAISRGENLLIGMMGAAGASLATIAAVNWITKKGFLKDDAAIGLVFPILFATGMIMISLWFRGVHLDADSVLFGEIAFAPLDRFTLRGQDLGPRTVWIGLGLFLANFLYLWFFKHELSALTFDRESSQVAGVRSRLVLGIGMVLLAVTASAAFSAAGAVMSTALLVMPSVIAGLWTRKLNPLMVIAVLCGPISSVSGVGLASTLDLSVSGFVVVSLFGLLAGSVLIAPERGLLVRAAKVRRQRSQFGAEMLIVHLATHQGTEGEKLESTYDHLIEELDWTPEQAQTAIQEAVKREEVTTVGGVLQLTESGLKKAMSLRRR